MKLRQLLVGAAAALAAGCEAMPPTPDFFQEPRTPEDLGAFFDCLRERSLTVVSAHRGGDSPVENAISAFERTVRGAPGPVLLEVDVRRTRDGRLVLMHDETLTRTTTGSGRVADLDAAAFARLRLKDVGGDVLKESPPTLRQALDWAEERAVLELDVKTRNAPGLLEETIDLVRNEGALDRVILIAPSVDDAIAAHRRAPEMLISVSMDDAADVDRLAAAGVDLDRILAWTGTRQPNPQLYAALAQRGIESKFGTLGSGPDSWDQRFAAEQDVGYAALSDTGVHIIGTDRPLEAMRAIDDADGEGAPALECLSARPK